MARSTAILVAVGAVCGAEARTYSQPKHSIKMKQRTRPIKDEQTLRVDTLHTHMKDLRLDVLPDALKELDTTYSTPKAESEAYYAYPLTLDYVRQPTAPRPPPPRLRPRRPPPLSADAAPFHQILIPLPWPFAVPTAARSLPSHTRAVARLAT